MYCVYVWCIYVMYIAKQPHDPLTGACAAQVVKKKQQS